MLPILQIGPLAVQTPGLVLIFGLWLGLSFSEKAAPAHGVNPGNIYNLAFTSLIAGIIGARLSFVIQYPAVFTANPISLISLNPGLLDSSGGLALALVAASIYLSRRKMPFWQTLDAFTPALSVSGIALGVAHLAGGNAFGMPTSAPWGIQLWGARRQPSQVYEIFFALIIFGIIMMQSQNRRKVIPGITFLDYAAMTAGSRLFLEAFRGDSQLIGGGFRAAQILAWIILAACLWQIAYRKRGLQSEQVSSS